jgi:hypothetical protein
VNRPLSERELHRLAISEHRGRPGGEGRRVKQPAGRLGLEHTIRREGRPANEDTIGN